MTATNPGDTGLFISLTDGALDTLGCVFQTLSKESFPLEPDKDPREFAAHCLEIARHIENGAAAPGIGIETTARSRDWSAVRRFFMDRRRSENSFVSSRLEDYRDIVEHFIMGLKEICAQNDTTKQLVTKSFDTIEAAIGNGSLGDVKKALALAVNDVGAAFEVQERQYERQISTLNQRVDVLRDDLVAAHEEMQLDSLTDICNRGAFDAALQRHVNTYFILHQPVSIIMIDVDNFKMVNDSFGHPTGDSVLQAIAGCLSRSFVRRNDIVARYGGDEFAVILPDSDINGSSASIRRMLAAINAIEIGTGEGDDAQESKPALVLSCSAGCTEIRDDDSVESLIARADQALYEAKQAGRNRFRTA